MATSFTVILDQRRHFGDQRDLFGSAPFAGSEAEFSFQCPNIDLREDSVLMFQSRHVSHEENVLQVNGLQVFGGLPVSPAGGSAEESGWNGNILIVNQARHSLQETGNRLFIRSLDSNGGTSGNRDDFVVDNIVIFYKTRS